LKLEYDEPLSSSAFEINMRSYILVDSDRRPRDVLRRVALAAGAYTPPLFGSN